MDTIPDAKVYESVLFERITPILAGEEVTGCGLVSEKQGKTKYGVLQPLRAEAMAAKRAILPLFS